MPKLGYFLVAGLEVIFFIIGQLGKSIFLQFCHYFSYNGRVTVDFLGQNINMSQQVANIFGDDKNFEKNGQFVQMIGKFEFSVFSELKFSFKQKSFLSISDPKSSFFFESIKE